MSFEHVQVKFASGETKEFESYDDLRTEIINGNVNKYDKVFPLSSLKKKEDIDMKRAEWVELMKFVKERFSLQILYRPIQAYIKKGFFGGLGIGLLSNLLISNPPTPPDLFALVQSDPKVLLIYMLVAQTCVFLFFLRSPKSHIRIFSAVFVLISALAFVLLALNLDLERSPALKGLQSFGWWMLAGMIPGAVLGSASGMIMGTIIGHFKSKTLLRAADAEPEGFSPYVIGLILPALILVIAVTLHFG